MRENYVLSIDPGKFKVAYAVWTRGDGKLIDAGLIQRKPDVAEERVDQWRLMAHTVWGYLATLTYIYGFDLVVEIPQVYAGPREEDPNDLIDLAGVVGAISSSPNVGTVEWSPQPREWKGQIPKEVTQKRVDKRLTPEEKAKIQWPVKHLAHNVYDAIHLGLVYLEREGLRLTDRYPKKG